MRARERLRFPLPVKTQRQRREIVSHRLQHIKASAAMILISFMFLFAAALNPALSQEIEEIKSNAVVIRCTGSENKTVTWYKDDKTKDIEDYRNNQTIEVKADQGIAKGFYRCKYGNIEHVFYLRVQVCENCYELSRLRATGIILGDVVFTGVVILFIFLATKNCGGPQKRASNPKPANPPPPPNPDYAPLDPKTRNNAVYSGIR
ncbi:T-cell surface glycoprotein CD3 epsilon chain [Carassius gibelio]|uniref:T-cell surface glycoprotein CD3 epsilon chain n=1 Tax=Carassius gibelio TaxID=101364 RepID=UPI0022798BEE|nr:T-cell surface glycoprotein CD3 epsilon chain [Carassius gibelio]